MEQRPAVIVTDPRWSPCRPAVAWRMNVQGGLASLHSGVEVGDLSTVRSRVGDAQIPSVVVAESQQALDELQTATGWSENLWFPVFPSAPHDWPEGAPWVELVRACADKVAGFLTDSELSRDQIEAALSDRRVEVVVLPAELQPQRGSVAALLRAAHDARVPAGADDPQLAGLVALGGLPDDFRRSRYWSFAGAKVLPVTSFAVEGSSWEFTDATGQGQEMAAGAGAGTKEALVAGLRRLLSGAPTEGTPVPTAVLGPQLGFIDQLARELTRRRRASVQTDQWRYLSGPGGRNERTPALLEQSRVVIAEWARPNGQWIQEHAPAETRLIVRAHRYEVTKDFPRRLDMQRYDAAVVIAPWVGRTLVQKFGWPAEKLVFIPNYVEGAHFRRPKLSGAEFTLGMVGIRPNLKRFDLALDLLERLREVDPRYALRVRGDLPPGLPNWEEIPELRQQWGRCRQRIRESQLLRNAVFLDDPGRDMSSWYRQIGVILSLSDLEGSHVALAEGVASGAVPVARPWPGITTLWPEHIVAPTLDAAVERVLDARRQSVRQQSRDELGQLGALDDDRVAAAWEELITGDRESAQAYFGPIDWQAPPMDPVRPVLVSDPLPSR